MSKPYNTYVLYLPALLITITWVTFRVHLLSDVYNLFILASRKSKTNT